MTTPVLRPVSGEPALSRVIQVFGGILVAPGQWHQTKCDSFKYNFHNIVIVTAKVAHLHSRAGCTDNFAAVAGFPALPLVF